MRNPLHIFYFMLLVFLSYIRLSAQQPDESIIIDNPGADILFYCGNPVAVTPGIIIENYNVDQPSDGIKISIANYVTGEDVLFYTGNKFLADWDPIVGNLTLTGKGTSAELQEAARNVFYENTAAAPSTEFRSISISLLDADFLPETGHFYKFIPQVDITWNDARSTAAAPEREYHGLQGYLATITSSVENDFIWSKVDGLGWIGATDEGENEEGTWRWATGPEAGTVFWQGDADGQPVNGLYSNWSEGEPNDSYGEDYAHINQDPNKADKTWNDLRAGGDGIPGSAYRSQGFIVEYGGMDDDPKIQLSASAVVGVNQVPEISIDEYDTLVCGEREQQVNIHIDQNIPVKLRPLDPNSRVLNDNTLTPTVQVTASGRFRFELEVYNENQCSWYDTITISFQHQPVAALNIDKATCVGYSLELYFDGDVEGDALFEWYRNDTLFDSGVNLDNLQIPLGKGQSSRTAGLKIIENGCTDSVQIPVTVKPVLDIFADHPEGCSPLKVQFNYSASEEVEELFWDFEGEGTSVSENPALTFENTDTVVKSYNVSLRILSAEGCEVSDTIDNRIKVHPAPSVDLDFSESVCYEGNEEIWYKGSAGSEYTFRWDLTDLQPEEIVENPGNSAGPLQVNLIGSPTAEIGLQVVSRFGCNSDTLFKTFKRKPVFSLPADSISGCPPFNVPFSLSTSDFSDQVIYSWDLGNGQTEEGVSVTAEYLKENQYFDVSVTAVSSLTGCSDSLFLPGKVFVHPAPSVDIDFNESTCYEGNEEIWYKGSAGSEYTFRWDLTDLQPEEIVENPGNSAGPLQVNLIGNPTAEIGLQVVSRFGCNSDTLFKTFKRKPVFSLPADSISGCPPFNVPFSLSTSDFSDQVIYSWDLGNGQTEEGVSVTAEYIKENQYFDVSVTAVSSLTGCSDSLFLPGKVFVHPAPSVDIDFNESTCYEGNEEIWYKGSAGSGESFIWDLTDLQPEEIVENPGNSAGPLQVNLIGSPTAEIGLQVVSRFGCNSDTLFKTFKRKPVFSLPADSISGCPPFNVPFSLSTSDFSDQVIYSWDLGNGQTEEGVSVTAEYIKENQYFDVSVTAVSSLTGCSDSLFLPGKVFVHPAPSVDIDFNESTCYEGNEEIWYKGSVGSGDTFIWDLTDIQPEEIVENPGNSAGPLQLNLTGSPRAEIGLQVVSGFGCKTDTLFKTFKRKPVLSLPADTISGCPPFNVQFSLSTSDFTDQVDYKWDLGNGQTDEGASVSQQYTEENQYFDVSVTAFSSLTGCSDSLFLPGKVFVHPAPSVDIDFNESTCYEGNEEIWYKGSVGSGDTFLWDLTDIQPEEIVENPGNSAGPLQLNLTGSPTAEIGLQVVSGFGCKTDTLFKTFKRKPVLSLPADTISGCPPFNVQFSLSTSDFTDQVDYKWDLGNGQTDEGASVSQQYTEENQYFDVSVTAFSSLTGCSDSLFLPGKVFVYPVPEADFSASRSSVLVTDAVIQFENFSQGATQYEWDFDDDSFGTSEQSPDHKFEKLGYFDVSLLVVNEFGCTDSAFTRIEVNFDKVFPPTAFSPNAALQEDREFRIYADGIVNEGYKLLIFNRWGEIIFTSESPENGWDGKMKNGSNAPAGSYLWVLEYFDFQGKTHTQKGSVTLFY